MIYTQAFDRFGGGKTVRAGVIGTGQYATAVITQAQAIPRLEVPVVADLSCEAAARSLRLAGVAEEQIAFCESRAAALAALERGQRVVLTDALLMMNLPIDVIVEATGVAEAGARHALAAIRQGKHVAMVNKEADVTVGPILKRLADRAGVVYTAVDGDQHGLLIGLVGWARELGLEVLCGGKARNAEIIFDEATGALRTARGEPLPLPGDSSRLFGPLTPGEAEAFVQGRLDLVGEAGEIGNHDLEETVIAANATGLAPDVEYLHHPLLRIAELPEALCSLEDGGILRRRGAIETITCLRGPHEAGMGGGVFLVVSCANDYSRSIITMKGLLANHRNTASAIYRPHHLCGVETPISILAAALLGLPTSATEYRPCFDVLARTRTAKSAGETLHERDLRALARPAQPVGESGPLPIQMAYGCVLTRDIPADTVITADMIALPKDSTLWALRREQDATFLGS